MDEPSVRARHLKSVLAAIDRLRERAAVRARIPAEALSDVEGAHGSDWLPVAHDLAFARALHAVLGKAAMDAFNRCAIGASFEGPLFRTLVRAAAELLGVDPVAWARWIPKGWRLTFRDCGEWTVERAGPNEVMLTLSALPAACADDPVWPGSVASSLSAVVGLAAAEGGITLERVDPVARTAVYAMRWVRSDGA